MAKIRDLREHTELADSRSCSVQPDAAESGDGERLREALRRFLAAAADGSLPLHLPQLASAPVARGDGHFHLSPELFLQLSGWTEFRFPGQPALRLKAGEALVVPPQLRHDERVGAARGDRFANIVVFAEGPRVSCHLAREIAPGLPGVAHLEACDHPKAGRIHDHLFEACGATSTPWAAAQGRALAAAAVAGVLDVLAAQQPPTAEAEPALVTRVRVLVQNQLGDPALSVARLAEQSGCSVDHLSQQFRQSSGENLLACINRLRIERAARLLRETSLAGKEVAWACGFSAHNYFIRVFRQQHGVTPQQWRLSTAAVDKRVGKL
ncbi:AraC family transcriptional regulator [Paucibacter sp. R3-3]|uniref:AraC family transcriptional regulator n=1 Tax=Roseateles agri TaxID=3098619 RepID=A0ABU5DS90_9BURK|nr:AraC family transcriptional regulator [Paucibacter sp. R3-3]MDY0748623.1 AraC family transcriptional regulator [Paucibacter sp. R3-3]